MANVNRTRRGLLAAAGATVSAAVLSACGSSTVESAFTPSRFISFGDGFSDVGQSGSRYTVNDGTVNIWAQQVASSYGGTLTPVSAGGFGYATAHARISNTTNAIGTANAGSVTTQIDAFLANLATAGRALAAQVRRLVSAGAQHILTCNLYDLGVSPWAEGLNLSSLFSSASSTFNTAYLAELAELNGSNTPVLFVDAAYYFNLFHNAGGSFGFSNVNDPVCTSVDAGVGIGIGAGQVNSALCTTSTLISGVTNYSVYMFADRLYPSPAAHRQFGTYAYDRLRVRW